MSEKTNIQQSSTRTVQVGNESLNNFANLQPTNIQERSLNSMANLKPNSTTSQANTQDKNSSSK